MLVKPNSIDDKLQRQKKRKKNVKLVIVFFVVLLEMNGI